MPLAVQLLLFNIPPEIVLHILSYLDLPDLAALVQAFPFISGLAADPILHKNRIRVIAPSRVQHSLFGVSSRGLALRPTVGDLVQRGVIRGLGIERRWRTGAYFYSCNSITQYENSQRLARRHASDVVSVQLNKRRSLLPAQLLASLHVAHILPDVESSSLKISRNLLPVMHKLKWLIQCDQFSKLVRPGLCGTAGNGSTLDFGAWLESKGHGMVGEGERVRLAVCPNIRKTVAFYEGLMHLSE